MPSIKYRLLRLHCPSTLGLIQAEPGRATVLPHSCEVFTGETPGTSIVISVKFLPLIGKFSTASLPMTVPNSDVEAWSKGASPNTCTVSETCPTERVIFNVTVTLTATLKAATEDALKPDFSALRLSRLGATFTKA